MICHLVVHNQGIATSGDTLPCPPAALTAPPAELLTMIPTPTTPGVGVGVGDGAAAEYVELATLQHPVVNRQPTAGGGVHVSARSGVGVGVGVSVAVCDSVCVGDAPPPTITRGGGPLLLLRGALILQHAGRPLGDTAAVSIPPCDGA